MEPSGDTVGGSFCDREGRGGRSEETVIPNDAKSAAPETGGGEVILLSKEGCFDDSSAAAGRGGVGGRFGVAGGIAGEGDFRGTAATVDATRGGGDLGCGGGGRGDLSCVTEEVEGDKLSFIFFFLTLLLLLTDDATDDSSAESTPMDVRLFCFFLL